MRSLFLSILQCKGAKEENSLNLCPDCYEALMERVQLPENSTPNREEIYVFLTPCLTLPAPHVIIEKRDKEDNICPYWITYIMS